MRPWHHIEQPWARTLCSSSSFVLESSRSEDQDDGRGRAGWDFVDAVGARQSTAFVERGARAFTLLEVLIAVVVFSVVLAAMNAVFYGAMRLRNRATAAMETARPTQQALALIKRDLASLVLPGGPLSGALQTTSTTNTIVGQASPAFYTASGLIDETSPFAQVQRVSYLLADSTNRTGGRDLFRAVSRNLLPTLAEDPPVLQWLMSGVDRLAFLFYDGMQWRDLWDSATEPTVLPLAIKVQIALAIDERGQGVRAPIELVVPVTVQAGTNQTQQATGGGQ